MINNVNNPAAYNADGIFYIKFFSDEPLLLLKQPPQIKSQVAWLYNAALLYFISYPPYYFDLY